MGAQRAGRFLMNANAKYGKPIPLMGLDGKVAATFTPRLSPVSRTELLAARAWRKAALVPAAKAA